MCLLRHSDPEGQAAHGLVPFVIVAQVGALQFTLHRQLGVEVPLGQEQLDGDHRLHVVGLEETPQPLQAAVRLLLDRLLTHVSLFSVIREKHFIQPSLVGEILHLEVGVALAERERERETGSQSGADAPAQVDDGGYLGGAADVRVPLWLQSHHLWTHGGSHLGFYHWLHVTVATHVRGSF